MINTRGVPAAGLSPTKTLAKSLGERPSKKQKETELKNRCLNLDIYGRTVHLTFQGKDTFRTNFGAASTIFVIVALLIFVCFRLVQFRDPLQTLPMQSHVDSETVH